jgi:chemotaxis protein methyltransferase CheR
MNRAGALPNEHYAAISGFLESQAGIRLGDGKEYLVTSRLNRLLRDFKLADYGELCRALKGLSNQRLQAAVVDAMTTNETFWFRDPAHYKILTHGILKGKPVSSVRIWSAAVSTGQEAYSIAISLQDAMRDGTLSRSLRYEIIGTDISPSALEQARGARYCGVSASRGLTPDQRRKYFREDQDCIEVLPEYRRAIALREFNLMKPYDTLGRFDVIFCRNVLIYFSQERKRDIIERFARSLNPGGYLFLGSTESMSSHTDLFEMQHINGGLAFRRRD